MLKNLNIIIIVLIFSSIIIPQYTYTQTTLIDRDFITDEAGVLRMNVNIIGHVKRPGTYLLYDNIDILSAISTAGGYLSGANLSNIIVYSKDGDARKINLKRDLSSSSNSQLLKINPHDTIYIEENTFSKIFISSNLPAVILGILNIALTLERTK